MAEKQITGRHVLAVAVAAFGVIIGVNVLMAYKAVSTFPGLEVKNSYVASQQFDAKRDAQQALGWVIEPVYKDGELTLEFRTEGGASVIPQDLNVLIGRTTESRDDIKPEFSGYAGKYSAPVELARGKWMMRVEATSEDGTPFQQRLELIVRG